MKIVCEARVGWLDRLSVIAMTGDLLSYRADGIVCNVNTKLALNYAVGRQLARIGGKQLIHDIEAAARQLSGEELTLGEAISVKTGALPAVSNLILVAWWGKDNEYTTQLLYKAIIGGIRQALHHGMRSLAMPMFGTGSGKVTAGQFADHLFQILKDLDGLSDSESYCLEEIAIVSDRCTDIEVLDRYLGRRL